MRLTLNSSIQVLGATGYNSFVNLKLELTHWIFSGVKWETQHRIRALITCFKDKALNHYRYIIDNYQQRLGRSIGCDELRDSMAGRFKYSLTTSVGQAPGRAEEEEVDME